MIVYTVGTYICKTDRVGIEIPLLPFAERKRERERESRWLLTACCVVGPLARTVTIFSTLPYSFL